MKATVMFVTMVLAAVLICSAFGHDDEKKSAVKSYQMHGNYLKRSNAELINGILGGGNLADLQRMGKRASGVLRGRDDLRQLMEQLRVMGKRSNAELINGLMGMSGNYGDLAKMGKRNAELINGMLNMQRLQQLAQEG